MKSSRLIRHNIRQLEDQLESACKYTYGCTSCNNCCKKVIAVRQSEIENVNKLLERNHRLYRKIIRILRFVPLDVDICPFLNLATKSKHKCLLYKYKERFEVCKIFYCGYSMDSEDIQNWGNASNAAGDKVINADLRHLFFNAPNNMGTEIKAKYDIWRGY